MKTVGKNPDVNAHFAACAGTIAAQVGSALKLNES